MKVWDGVGGLYFWVCGIDVFDVVVEVWYEFEIDVLYGVGYEYVVELFVDFELLLFVGGELYVVVFVEVGDGC